MSAACVNPCPSCPFRKDSGIKLGREVAQDVVPLIQAGGAFMCHKTIEMKATSSVNYHVDNPSPKARQCFGSMVASGKVKNHTSAPIVESFDAFVALHAA